MAILISFSLAAGLVTVLSPCILPVLPILLAGSVGQGKQRPVGIITGFVLSFTFFTLALSTIVAMTGISSDVLRGTAIALIGVFGLFLLVPKWQLVFETFVSRFMPSPATRQAQEGFGAGLAIGVTLGVLWTPCVGPILASVITLAASNKITAATFVITLAYALGTAVPMFTVMLGGQKLMHKTAWLKSNSQRIQRGFGAVMIVFALVMGLGFDKKLESWLLSVAPDYAIALISIDDNARVQGELKKLQDD